ncbi:hypothetical protein DK842_22640 [Chromobacterium phragmitis]|uniref:hypothetical protein n=1 Tax=Chromobacterium phragmitis TaxID=2202141 RepID=UPI000DED11E2|nr:hypothetical protein [Chromobacterium phragmitis]AXE32465.1 hypothetical protein DK842_22640 [Chromobacterium phragmitis]
MSTGLRDQNFGDAESLALDDMLHSGSEEPPAARGAQRHLAHEEVLSFDEAEEQLDPSHTPHKQNNVQRIALLALIGCAAAAMVGHSLWQKFAAASPADAPAATEFQAIAHPSVSKTETSPPSHEINAVAPAKETMASDGAMQAQPAPPAQTISMPQILPPSAKPLAQRETGQSASMPTQTAAQAEQSKAQPDSNTSQSSPTLSGSAQTAREASSGQAESPEEKIARLEKEISRLRAASRPKPHGSQTAKNVRPKKAEEQPGTSKVLGMSATSVWVRQKNGKALELKVGDRFKNGEVIQRIDQQTQVVETDRNRYQVNF